MDRLSPALAFPAIALLPGAADALLRVQERNLSVARVMARKGQGAGLRERVRARFGLELPDGPRLAAAREVSLAGVGPGAWLAMSESATPGFAQRLAHDLAGAASVADQSGTYAVLRLSGPGVTEVLAAGAFIDFHPEVFTVGGVAVTSVALLDAIILKRDAETFDVMVFRSFATDFWRFVEETAAAWNAPLARA